MSMTVREWLDIWQDLDGYIAKGGRLLDLELVPLDQVPAPVLEFMATQMGKLQTERVGCFFKEIAASMPDKSRLLSDVLSEDEMQAIWRYTCAPKPIEHPEIIREYTANMALKTRDLRLDRTGAGERADGERRYQIRDYRNKVVAGPSYEMTLEDVEAFVANTLTIH